MYKRFNTIILGANHFKLMYEMYAENYKMLITEVKEYFNKWGEILGSYIVDSREKMQ